MSWPSFSAFIRDRTVGGPTLVCPVRVLWRAYLTYCEEWGFEPAVASEFVVWLHIEEGVTIVTRGRGRLRRVALGIGTKQEEDHARNA